MTASLTPILTALASEPRRQVLNWLQDPEAHFRAQKTGDMRKDGVCGTRIAEKLDFSAPTVTRHMKLLLDARLVEVKRIKQWRFYKRDEAGIARAKQLLQEGF